MKHFSEISVAGPPDPTHVEVCVFGPSYGECILVHLGELRWVVIDSCSVDGEPAALSYLKAIKVDPSAGVVSVIATHWHDDHCRGLSDIIRACPNAQICVADALTDVEFLKFKERMAQNKTPIAGTKLKEFSNVYAEIVKRVRGGSPNFCLAASRTSLLRLASSDTTLRQPCELLALSPSHADKIQFLDRVTTSLPLVKKTKRSVSGATPNEVSMVTVINVGDGSILLGADLENSNHPSSGLEAVVAMHRLAPLFRRASLFKVSHHGSSTGYNADIWAELLTDRPYAAITPWRNGGGRLPSKQEARRLNQHSDEIYISASDARSPSARRSPAVRRQLTESGSRVRSLASKFGMVRFRAPAHDLSSWKVELFGDACHLRQFVRRKPVR